MRHALARSKSEVWAPSQTIPISVKFLESYLSRFRAPVIHQLWLIQTLNVTTAAGNTFAGRDNAVAMARVRLADKSGDRINVRGFNLRLINQVEFGSAFHDPATQAASTTANITSIYRMPFSPKHRAVRRNDFGINLSEFLDGGVFEVSTGDATPNDVATNIGTVNSGTYQVFALIVDEFEPEAKSRMIWRDTAISNVDDIYACPGLLRGFFASAGEIGVQNGRSWSTVTANNITSNTLDYSLIPRTLLADFHESESQGVPYSVVTSNMQPNDDIVQTPNVIPLWSPRQRQKSTELPYVKSVHFQMDGTLPAASDLPQAVICYIAQRSDAQLESAFGGNAQQIRRGLATAGYIKTASGKPNPLQNWPQHLQSLMPIKGAHDRPTLGFRKALMR